MSSVYTITKLQWSRNFIVAEIIRRQRHHTRGGPASMGPQLYRCGNSGIYAVSACRRNVSMGPQLYRCGNGLISFVMIIVWMWLQWGRNFIVAETEVGEGHPACPFVLQWGRNFIVAEMSWDYPTCVGVVLASMRPQLYRCGNSAVAGVRATNTSASMRPQLYRCGNVVGLSNVCRGCLGFNEAATLSLRK